MTFSDTDARLMREALALAATVRRRARPNPAVGCVIVADGAIIGRGATEPPGGRHAEIVALDGAGSGARGAHVYVTLEPCSHHGRTPPCTDALIAAGVGSVTFAAIDPNPVNRGAGAGKLRRAGIDVRHGLLVTDAEALNPGFNARMRLGRPYVVAKLAVSLDGAPAMRSGESQWITGPQARAAGHALRAAADALVTGIGTVLADDPSLNARRADGTPAPEQPLRVVVDTHGRLPATARLHTVGAPVLQLTAAPPATVHAGETQILAPGPDGRIAPAAVLAELARREISEVLLEAGPTLTGAFASAGLIDEFRVFVAPRLLGSETRPALLTPAWTRLAEGCALDIDTVERVGADLAIRARVRRDR